jgi:hypothetical protein
MNQYAQFASISGSEQYLMMMVVSHETREEVASTAMKAGSETSKVATRIYHERDRALFSYFKYRPSLEAPAFLRSCPRTYQSPRLELQTSLWL